MSRPFVEINERVTGQKRSERGVSAATRETRFPKWSVEFHSENTIESSFVFFFVLPFFLRMTSCEALSARDRVRNWALSLTLSIRNFMIQY